MTMHRHHPHPLSRGRRLRDPRPRGGQRILLDPFLDENPGQPGASDGFDKVDLVVVSHAAFDHLGDTDKIAARYGCPVVCGGEVKAWLMDRGIPADADPRHHLGHPGQGRGDRDPAARVPSLVADPAPGRQLHLGGADGLHRRSRRERALLPLRRHRDLLRPEAAGRALPADDRLHRHRQPAGDPAPEPDAGRDADRRDEPARGLSRHAVARASARCCPATTSRADGDPDVAEYMRLHGEARARGEAVADALVLRPGDSIALDAAGRIVVAEAAA